MGFDFGSVYVRGASLADVARALKELMSEKDLHGTAERGLDPKADDVTSEKAVRSFALMPPENDWVAVLEDGHPQDDGGVAEGLSDLLETETLHLAYSDAGACWSYERYWEGQPLESGGSDDPDYDVGAMSFVDAQALPHFGVYYEEVAAASGSETPALAGSLQMVGDIRPRLPMGTEIVTFCRRTAKKG